MQAPVDCVGISAACVPYHHSNVVFGAIATLFDSFINDDIHEWIETAQNAIHSSAAVQFQHHSFVHEPCGRLKNALEFCYC